MHRAFVITLALLCLVINAHANVFNLGAGLTNLETVTVGDAGNAADTLRTGDGSTGRGAVGYTYNIGKCEVTAAQYCDFLNRKAKIDAHSLYRSGFAEDTYGCHIQRTGGGTVANPYTYSVASEWANRPVNGVSFWSACRFTNWLNNGQGDGDTETGTYTLTSDGIKNNTVVRNSGAIWAVTSENEWYKAAYYKGNGTNSGYWLYPTKSNNTPSNVGADGYTDPGNHANYILNSVYTLGTPYARTNVGEFENSTSAYGTFDQGGNVSEWNDTIIAGSFRGERGGSFFETYSNFQASSYPYWSSPSTGYLTYGFRVVQLSPVPEPSSILALACGLITFAGFRRRRS